MTLALTLSRYLAKSYFLNMVFLLLALFGIIYLFDTVELIRRASKSDDVPLSLVLQMGLLKLPEVGQLLFPFAVLFAIKGFCFAAFQFLPLSMLADIVDLDTARSREHRTGLFFAISGMAQKAAMALAAKTPRR